MAEVSSWWKPWGWLGGQPAFQAEDSRLLDLPAIFPDMGDAMARIDELRRLVSAHLAQAATGASAPPAPAPAQVVSAPADVA